MTFMWLNETCDRSFQWQLHLLLTMWMIAGHACCLWQQCHWYDIHVRHAQTQHLNCYFPDEPELASCPHDNKRCLSEFFYRWDALPLNQSKHWKITSIFIVPVWVVFIVQIPTSQTSCLGGDRRYMQQFLSIIESRINSRVIDTTLKFTLSALWNLSGNSSLLLLAAVSE